MKTESSAVNPYNGLFGQQGWICPKCGRVYVAFTPMCLCCGGETTIMPYLCDRINMPVNEEKLKEDRKQDNYEQNNRRSSARSQYAVLH